MAGWDAFVAEGCAFIQGDLVITAGPTTPATLPALTEVTGALRVYPPELRGLVLPNLHSVGGPVYFSGAKLAELALPSLQSVGDDLTLTYANSLVEFSLPKLSSVGGSLSVTSNEALGGIDLPVLATVTGGVEIFSNNRLVSVNSPQLSRVLSQLPHLAPGVSVRQNDSLGAFELPSLSAVWSLQVWYNPTLRSLAFPILSEASADISIGSNLALTSLSFPALRSVPHGELVIVANGLQTLELPVLTDVWATLHLQDNEALESVRLPALEQIPNYLEVQSNGSLRELSVPRLAAASVLTVIENPRLPQCEVLAIKDRLVDAGTIHGWRIEGNDTAATCGP